MDEKLEARHYSDLALRRLLMVGLGREDDPKKLTEAANRLNSYHQLLRENVERILRKIIQPYNPIHTVSHEEILVHDGCLKKALEHAKEAQGEITPILEAYQALETQVHNAMNLGAQTDANMPPSRLARVNAIPEKIEAFQGVLIAHYPTKDIGMVSDLAHKIAGEVMLKTLQSNILQEIKVTTFTPEALRNAYQEMHKSHNTTDIKATAFLGELKTQMHDICHENSPQKMRHYFTCFKRMFEITNQSIKEFDERAGLPKTTRQAIRDAIIGSPTDQSITGLYGDIKALVADAIPREGWLGKQDWENNIVRPTADPYTVPRVEGKPKKFPVRFAAGVTVAVAAVTAGVWWLLEQTKRQDKEAEAAQRA